MVREPDRLGLERSRLLAPGAERQNTVVARTGATVLTSVSVLVVDGKLVVEPQPKPRYTMAELLAQSDYAQPQPAEEREWVDAPAVGKELL